MSKPTLIFAPGAWYPPTAFDPLIAKLPDYTCHTIAFPAIQQATTVTDLRLDISAVRTLVEREADAGRDVVIVLHSWAGLPVNSALDGLSKDAREKEGKEGGVVRLVFIAAFIPEIGENLVDALGGPAEWFVRDVENGTVTASDPFTLFFHDVPDGHEWAKTLRPHSWAAKTSPATSAAYLEIPNSYLLCEDDRAISLFAQEAMVEKARQKGAVFETEMIKTAHTPWLVPEVMDEVARYIRRQAGEVL
ncbi:alpha/beta hydrolase [Aspergillus glaucus CBS 516.65]|uniref:AB hydrolase-1 domain-containing protein n=1 Tax=Aspergillus glaucus CBS 516.65 TaxID=1160497 RepID=A0A1L9V7F3_ASPGL|nr:hypothetical protein ASPGLDRAFT_29406 [Aspergillus glaucus CBS 516.65]OJJ79846.1 hypothetical protein ASPGLDRAFT_29406 [Aspergillus glaucus CBS 516.65]